VSSRTPGVLANAIRAPFGRGAEADLEKQLSDIKPDIVHAHNLFPLLSPRLFQIARRSGARTVLSLHNYRPMCLNGLFLTPGGEICERCSGGNYAHGIVRGCYRESRVQSSGLSAHLWASRANGWYDAVDRFIAPAKFLMDKFTANGWDAARFVVQGHFLPEMPLEPPAAPSDYILYLGRLSAEKGIPWLLDLFEKPASPYRLHIAGDGPLRSHVESRQSAHIRYLGQIEGEEKQRQLRQAAVLVMPSECYENFPVAIIEANACGTPALVSDHGGLREIVEAGVNGERYKPRDPTDFWSVLVRLTRPDQSMTIRKSSLIHARDHFSKQAFLKKRVELYEQLMNNRSC